MRHRVNICFHGIGTPGRDLEPGEDDYWISPDFFEEIVDYTKTHQASVKLSFDDGNASDVDLGLPHLAKRGMTAAFFPVAARLGKPGSVDPAGLRELAAGGMSVGSHGMHHQAWRGLTDAELDEELIEARRVIQRETGISVDAAACPLGSYDRRVLGRLRHLGYSAVYTSDRCTALPNSWLQPRFSVRRQDTMADIRTIVEQPEATVTRAKSLARTTIKRLR
jgi:peptidoglycan/xylan/chitin deacetylase (PgdA/CDA1 family)